MTNDRRKYADSQNKWKKENQKAINVCFSKSDLDQEIFIDLKSNGSVIARIREYYLAYKK